MKDKQLLTIYIEKLLLPGAIAYYQSQSIRDKWIITEAIKKYDKNILLIYKKDENVQKVSGMLFDKYDSYEYAVLAKIIYTENEDGEFTIILKGKSLVKIEILDSIITKKDDKNVLELGYGANIIEVLEEKELYGEEYSKYMYMVLQKLSSPELKNLYTDFLKTTDINSDINSIISYTLSIKYGYNNYNNIDNIKEFLLINDMKERFEKFISFLNKMIEFDKFQSQIEENFDYKIKTTEKQAILELQINYLKEELDRLLKIPKSKIEKNKRKVNDVNLYEMLEEIKNEISEKTYKKISNEIEYYYELREDTTSQANQFIYLKRLLELPFKVETEENIDLKVCKKQLDSEHYGLKDVKDRILEHLSIRKIKKLTETENSSAPILCFVGPPGVGKTSIISSIAKSINRKFVKISLAGVSDEAHIRGHRRTYVSAFPGKIMCAIEDSGVKNPIILLDEIDKISNSRSGEATSALMEVLDPSQNSHFTDNYFDIEFDISKVMFVATANTLSGLPHPLLDRLEIINLSGYTTEDKIKIAQKYLIKAASKETGVEISMSKVATKYLIENYTRELGVRKLKEHILKICRKRAYDLIINENDEFKELNLITEEDKALYLHSTKKLINKNDVIKYLEEPYRNDNKILKEDKVGVVTGLAWTSLGGDTLLIEVAKFKGNGKLNLTGQMGDVMKESANIAISYLKSKAMELNIMHSAFESYDIHIHIPEGAVPKDGPSAGITLASALLSALTGRKVNHKVAMTGELTLRGDVLAIGGLKEKSLAAHRDGIKKVIVPIENARDLKYEIPKSVKDEIEFITVKSVEEVFKHSLLKDTREEISKEEYIKLKESKEFDIEKFFYRD